MNNDDLFRTTLEKIFKNNRVTFGKDPIVCAPVINCNSEIKKIISRMSRKVKLVELRADYLISNGLEPEDCMDFLNKKGIPFIFTMRSNLEGGKVVISALERIRIMEKSLDKNPAVLDLELSTFNEQKNASKKLIEDAHMANIGIISSYHNFENTPDKDILKNIATEEVSMGGDILKIATFVKNANDVLTLMNLTLEIRKALEKPLAIMGMGNFGRITRIATVALGSDLIFADLFGTSAPGQIPYSKAEEMIKLFYYK